MVFLKKMKKDQQQKEIRQLIIENKTDPETAKLLIDEPKKAPKPGTIDVGNLRFACMMLGIGLGAGINWLADVSTKSIYFWLIVAFGVGIGMLCSFLVEMHLAKKQYPTRIIGKMSKVRFVNVKMIMQARTNGLASLIQLIYICNP